MITCPRCSFQAPDGSPYCPRCGYGRQPVQYVQPPAQPVEQPAPEEPSPHTEPKPEKKKDNSIFGYFAMIIIIIMLCMGLALCNGDLYRANQQNKELQQEITRQAAELSMYVQTLSAFPTEIPTPEPTEKAAVPALCKDKQMDLIRLAGYLDAKGFPFSADYDPDQKICLYRITDNDSFLGMGTFGYLSIFHDAADQPYSAAVTIDYKDSEEIRELIRDWGAVAVSYINSSTDVLTATEIVRNAMQTGVFDNGTVSGIAMLDTSQMQYQFVVGLDAALPQ